MTRPWQEEEVEYLTSHAESRSFQELAKRLDRDYYDLAEKMTELGVGAGDTQDRRRLYEEDAVVTSFGKALDLLNEEKWQKAADLLQKVVEETDLPEVAERARQMLRVCERKLEQDPLREADPFLRAVFEKNRRNYQEALRLCQIDDRQQSDERFAFLAASLYALENQTEKSVETLRQAIAMNPKNRVYAYHDPDFAVLRQNPENARLFGLPS